MDVYEFILNPNVATSFSLAEGDYISVGILGKVVGISGAVQRPYRYELMEGENLMKLIDFAGGMSENAYLAAIQVKRFVNDQEKIIDVNYRDLKTRGADFPLLKGDVVVVKAIPSSYKNFAKINGAVELPGNYEITEGLTINDLVKKAY
ncbi:MAG: hypothetical protein HC817_07770 [Saprospiraceae bacterium]|nr:hypothetical protein [Saprospiraceae bacterium]